MINNIEVIKSLLNFDSEDTFYFVQIIKRKKEHQELGSKSMIVKTYYIKSIEHLDKCFPEMICLADFHNARVCINLNKRSFEKMAFHNLKKVADIIMNKDYKSVKQSYDSVSGTYSNESDKKWLLDVDTKDISIGDIITSFINTLRPIGLKQLAFIPTKNGYHIITKPFELDVFTKEFPQISVHKDNPTILYIP